MGQTAELTTREEYSDGVVWFSVIGLIACIVLAAFS